MQRLSQLEEHALWALGHYPTGGVVAQVRGHLSRPLPYTTLASILHQLVHKGYARSDKRGRQHWFSACVNQEAYGRQQLTQLVANYFHGSYPALVACCVRHGLLTLAEVEATLQAAESSLTKPARALTTQPFSS